jgi:hypothetical protein
MRHRATVLVVGAVVLLVGAAVFDAIRTADRSEAPDAAALLADATTGDVARPGLSGVLYLTVRSGSRCEYRAVALPLLELLATGPLSTCRFQVSPDGNEVSELRECPPRLGRIRATFGPTSVRMFRGCAPAWQSTRTLTYLSNGAVVVAEDLDCLGNPGCLDVLVPRRAVVRGLALLRSGLRASSIARTSWLDPSRLAIMARVGPRAESIVFFEDGQPANTADRRFPLHSEIEVVSHGAELLVGGRGRGFLSLNSEGAFVARDRVPFADAAAVAESPDRDWLALARPGRVCIYRRPDSDEPALCFPADAQDLAWR